MPSGTGPPVLSVFELGELVREELRALFDSPIWVEGQVSNLHQARSGHVYFDLVEPSDEPGRAPAAVFNVALWKGVRSGVQRTLSEAGGLALADDLLIRTQVRLEFYAPRGRIQLIMEDIDPGFTLGRLAVERERLLRTLAETGLLERNGRLPVPQLPLRIGLVTSVGSAAHGDFCAELGRSNMPFTVLERDTRVQGEGVADEIAEGLRAVATYGPDVVALVRGGGSTADLVAFDAEAVARAIAELPVPVWTGIGHQVDRSIADEVAHTAFKTPTACAAALVETVQVFTNLLEAMRSGIVDHARRIVERAGSTQTDLTARLVRSARTALTRQREQVAGIAGRVRALDPDRILGRGWSITRLEDGRLLRSIADASSGIRMATTVADGTVTSTVDRGLND
ncbi:MAG: exodeoxyribonuclease VII large subunit [Actinomycetota bacterium]|nr:exodeoxyribonuclease VII large subunit [Actinomycetota bacterium]